MLRQLTRVASRNTRRISTIPSSGLKERLIELSEWKKAALKLASGRDPYANKCSHKFRRAVR